MPENKRCPKCGLTLTADSPEGLCLGCLAQLGLTDLIEDPGFASTDRQPLGGQAFGDYDQLEEIGRGGMGVIYKARQRSLNRTVALKVILSGQFASRQEVLRFRAEAEAVANLQHPNIVAIHETGEHEGQPYFSMEYVPGRNLAEMTRSNPLPFNTAARYVKGIAEAIDYAHQQNILHRDLKPSNVLIDEHDQPRITDFGLAKRLCGDGDMTFSGQVIGSPGFMPPEQAAAARSSSGPPADVYGLGAILYHLLTGRPPFQAETIDRLVAQVKEIDPVSPRLLNASVPRDLETVCLRCLQKRPEKRYATARALAEELGRFLRGEPILARRINPVEKTWRWCRRRPAIAALTTLVILTSVAGFLGVLGQLRQTERARRLAEDGLAQAIGAVTNYFLLVAKDRRLQHPDLYSLRSELLQSAIPFLDKFAGQENDTPQLALRRAATYRSLAEVQSTLGQQAEAVATALKCRAICLGLEVDPRFSAARHERAEVCALLGKLLRFTGDSKRGEAFHQEAICVGEKLVANFPREPEYLTWQGGYEADFATFLLSTGRLQDGTAMYRRSVGTLLQAIEHQPASPAPRRMLIRAILRGEGHLTWYEGPTGERSNALTVALEMQMKVMNTNKPSAEDRYESAYLLMLLGETQGQLGALTPGEKSLREARQQWDILVSEAPFEAKYALGLAGAWERLGTLLAVGGRWDASEQAFERSIEVLRPPSGKPLVHGEIPDQLARTYASRARCCAKVGNLDAACRWMEQARTQQESLLKPPAPQPRHLAPLARILGELGQFWLENGKPTKAHEAFNAALKHYQQLCTATPTEPYWQERAAELRAKL